MFEKVTIIGLGLIGSSIARNVLKHKLAKTLVTADINKDVCEKLVELELGHIVTDDLALGVEDADLVILAVPVGAMESVAKVIAPNLKQGAIVSDTGSVKVSVIEQIKPYLHKGVELVPAHPIAGTEFSGPESGFIELFEKKWCIITPLPETDVRAVEKVSEFWEAMGAVINIMDPQHHDLVLGITSHLPHLIAYTIVGTAEELSDDIKSEVIQFSASGFRDFTRIAASDPTMWRDVFLNNKDAVLEVLQRFNEDLSAMQKAIRKGDGEYLYQRFDKTRAIRKAIIEQKVGS
ncbi:MAG: prephenate/arogenate dehydrogenase family protein [Alphaproteobacteria bacterium]|nr:prephenate/arogenate dehydrogenase family protein [Alphaproteobacteria bacterium]